MNRRQLLIVGLVLAAIAGISIFSLDGALAVRLRPHAATNAAAVAPFMNGVELLFGFALSKFATGYAIVLAAVALLPFRRSRPFAWGLLFVGITHLATRLIAGVLKNVFLRSRPFEALAGGGWRDAFFVPGGSSFPSGHAAHFWALFFAVAIAFPKLRIPALILAIGVSMARVAVNDHYVSDVVASAAIAALVSVACARIMRISHMAAPPQATVAVASAPVTP